MTSSFKQDWLRLPRKGTARFNPDQWLPRGHPHRLSAALALACILLTSLAGCERKGQHAVENTRTVSVTADVEWRGYLGDEASNQYSPLTQIDRENVDRLQEAWRYDPGDADEYGTLIPTNPLVVKGILYGLSARKNLFALDAASGEELWVYPFDQPHGGKGAGRGLVYWEGRDRQVN